MKRAPTDLPPDFALTDDLRNWAKLHGYTRMQERMDYFIDYCRAKPARYADYTAAFRNSVRADWAKLNRGNGSADTVVNMGKLHGIEPKPGESMEAWQARIRQARH